MKFEMLGVAQDAGYPHPFCHLPCCNAVRQGQALEQLPAAAALISTGRSILFDATPALPQQLELLPCFPEAIFLTHAHIGHYTGLMYLGREATNTHNTPVYCSESMATFLRQNAPWSQLVELANIELRVVHAQESIHLIPGVVIQPFEVVHRSEFSNTYGFKIRTESETIVYVPDADTWNGWPIPLREILEDATSAYLDCTFYNAHELPGRDVTQIPHPLVVDTLKDPVIVEAMQRMQVYAIHLNHTNRLLQRQSHPVLLNTL